MSLRLKKQTVRMERILGEGRAETVAEGTVRLPERYPAVGRALYVTAEPVVTAVEPTEDRVLIEGIIQLALTYVAVEDEAPEDEGGALQTREELYRASWERELSFAYLLELVGATEESQVEVEAKVSGVSYEVRNDQATVDVDVVLDLAARLADVTDVELTVGATGEEVEVDLDQVRIRQRLGAVETSGRISAALPFGGRSVPERIVDVTAAASLAEVAEEEGETVIRGQIDCSALYMATEGAGAQCLEWPRGIGFALKAAPVGAGPQAVWAPDVAVVVRDYYVETGAEGAALRIDLDVTAKAVAYRTDVAAVVKDLSSEAAEVACRVEETEIYEAVGEGSTRTELQGVLELPDGLPPIERLLRGDARFVVEEVHVLGDKVSVEGQVRVDLLYVGRGEEEDEVHMARWPYAVAADFEVPVPGAEPGLDREVSAAVRRIDFDLINRETVEVRVQVACDARVGRMRVLENVVEAVAVPQEEEDRPTFTFVITTEDDTLWKLAQLYRTSVEAILEQNEWIDPEKPLGKGRKVCILR